MGKTKDVRAAVEKELSFDPKVNSAHITVRNISGDVTLTGTVPSYPQYLEAAAAAKRVAGVTAVDNHLEVVLPDSDFRDDVQLATAANNALAANVTVPAGVEATAEDGNITLIGTVAYGVERAGAEASVSGLRGSATSLTTSTSAMRSIRSTSTCTSRRPWTAWRWSQTAAT